MAHFSKEAVASQVQMEFDELEESRGLPFREFLDPARIKAALDRAGVVFRDRVFNPMVTIYAFLSQVTSSKSSSCEAATARVMADRVDQGKAACSADSSSYCEARGRLPEQVISDLVRETGQGLHGEAKPEWLWMQRPLKVADGSTATMEDTPENQKEYPQSRNQKVGLGFPILRFVVLISLSVGTVLECAIGPCRGKKTGEQNLFRQTWTALKAGDIVLGDRLFDCYRDIAMLRAGDIDVVFGKKQSRRCDFRTGRRLGPKDHVVVWKKPKYDKTRFQSREEWEKLPQQMEMREISLTIRRKGYLTRTVTVVTTLLDETKYPAKDITDLFAQRWHCELDLRSIKRVLGMHHLRCKTPEMVRKALWTHLLAYNLIRVRMAQAAAQHGVLPRQLSFTAAKNLIESFGERMKNTSGKKYARLETALLKAISQCKVGDRPGRKEPRAVKKRTKSYPYLTKPRAQARKNLPA